MMKNFHKLIIALGAVLVLGMANFAAPASAQATRTWVSGVGDDANPCSRTAPCKTFAGAISKTAAGGEINCLDPAGYGAVTITKAMTIDCHYTEGGVLAAGNGIVVNAGTTDVVYLRGLDIFGVSPPTNGVRFIAGGALHIQDCVIRRFNAAGSFGVSFQPGGASELYISNSTIAENGNGSTGGGILIQPTGAGGSARVSMSDVRMDDNDNTALRIDTAGNTSGLGINVTVDNSRMSGNGSGLIVNAPVGTTLTSVILTRSVVANNSGVGLNTSGGNAFLLVGTTTILGNGFGVSAGATSALLSYGDNLLTRNVNDGAFSGPAGKS